MIIRNSIGIDIQEESIAVVWLQVRFRKTSLAGSRTFSMPEGNNRTERLVQAGDLINQFIAEQRISSPEIFLAFPGEKAVVRTLHFPLSIKENFRETVKYELEKYVPFNEDQVYHDSRIIAEDKKKKELTILLTVIKKEDLTPYLRMCEHLKSGVTGLESVYSALVNGLANLPAAGSHPAFAYIHRSGSRYLISLIHNNRLLSGRSLSAEAVTGTSGLLAQELKVCRRQELLAEEPLPVLIARGSEIPAGIGQEDSDFSIEEIDPEGSIPAGNFIPAYGLAVKGLKRTALQVNLLPRALRKRPERKVLYFIYALVVLNIVLGVVWSGSAIMKKRMIREDLEQRITRIKSEVKGLDRLEQEVGNKRGRIKFLNNFQDDHPVVLVLLNELTGIIPETVWIDTFRLADGKVEIRGRAESASDLLPLLESSALFNDAAFTSTISKTDKGEEEFDIKLGITDGANFP